MALSVLQPMVLDFIDTLTGGRPDQRIVAEFEATTESGIVGKTLDDAIMKQADTIFLAVQKASGETIVGPAHSSIIETGDRMIVLGKEADLGALAWTHTHSGVEHSRV